MNEPDRSAPGGLGAVGRWARPCAAALAVGLVAGCAGAPRAREQREPLAASPSARSRTMAPNGQWTAEDIALFERLVTGASGTTIDIDHLTPAQLTHAARSIRRIHALAYPRARAERRALLLWVIGSTQVHVRICASLGDVVPLDADQPYTTEFTLSLAAATIESPDGVRQQLAAIEGLLVNYEAALSGGAARQPILEVLLADRAAGNLVSRATGLASCIEPGTVDP